VPASFRRNGIHLGGWIGKQRAEYKGGHLPKDKVKRLENLNGWSWDPFEDQWNNSYRELESFVRAHGHTLVRASYRPNGVRLARWISKQRAKYRHGQLSKDKVERLESLKGWLWDRYEDQWNSSYRELESFVKARGHVRVPRSYRRNGIRLESWIIIQRANHKRGQLSKDRVKRLESLKGWLWDPFGDQWNSSYGELESFVKAHGHALVPASLRQNGVGLGIWITNQRVVYRRGQLSKDRVKRLESLNGWSWDPLEGQWNSSYRALESFVKAHGHALVPYSYRQNNIQLGEWLAAQRTKHMRGQLPTDKVKRLESLQGWSWQVRRTSRTKSVPKRRRNQ
jgi:hypothetical protein